MYQVVADELGVLVGEVLSKVTGKVADSTEGHGPPHDGPRMEPVPELHSKCE